MPESNVTDFTVFLGLDLIVGCGRRHIIRSLGSGCVTQGVPRHVSPPASPCSGGLLPWQHLGCCIDRWEPSTAPWQWLYGIRGAPRVLIRFSSAQPLLFRFSLLPFPLPIFLLVSARHVMQCFGKGCAQYQGCSLTLIHVTTPKGEFAQCHSQFACRNTLLIPSEQRKRRSHKCVYPIRDERK